MGVGGWVESIIGLISAEAEAEALLGLAEIGNIILILLRSNILKTEQFIPRTYSHME